MATEGGTATAERTVAQQPANHQTAPTADTQGDRAPETEIMNRKRDKALGYRARNNQFNVAEEVRPREEDVKDPGVMTPGAIETFQKASMTERVRAHTTMTQWNDGMKGWYWSEAKKASATPIEKQIYKKFGIDIDQEFTPEIAEAVYHKYFRGEDEQTHGLKSDIVQFQQDANDLRREIAGQLNTPEQRARFAQVVGEVAYMFGEHDAKGLQAVFSDFGEGGDKQAYVSEAAEVINALGEHPQGRILTEIFTDAGGYHELPRVTQAQPQNNPTNGTGTQGENGTPPGPTATGTHDGDQGNGAEDNGTGTNRTPAENGTQTETVTNAANLRELRTAINGELQAETGTTHAIPLNIAQLSRIFQDQATVTELNGIQPPITGLQLENQSQAGSAEHGEIRMVDIRGNYGDQQLNIQLIGRENNQMEISYAVGNQHSDPNVSVNDNEEIRRFLGNWITERGWSYANLEFTDRENFNLVLQRTQPGTDGQPGGNEGGAQGATGGVTDNGASPVENNDIQNQQTNPQAGGQQGETGTATANQHTETDRTPHRQLQTIEELRDQIRNNPQEHHRQVDPNIFRTLIANTLVNGERLTDIRINVPPGEGSNTMTIMADSPGRGMPVVINYEYNESERLHLLDPHTEPEWRVEIERVFGNLQGLLADQLQRDGGPRGQTNISIRDGRVSVTFEREQQNQEARDRNRPTTVPVNLGTDLQSVNLQPPRNERRNQPEDPWKINNAKVVLRTLIHTLRDNAGIELPFTDTDIENNFQITSQYPENAPQEAVFWATSQTGGRHFIFDREEINTLSTAGQPISLNLLEDVANGLRPREITSAMLQPIAQGLARYAENPDEVRRRLGNITFNVTSH